MTIDDIVHEVSEETGYPVMVIREVYQLYWRCFEDYFRNLDFSNPDLTEEEFKKLRAHVSIAHIGKFGVPYQKYQTMKMRKEYQRKAIESKKNKDV